jgi:hypothetical protein
MKPLVIALLVALAALGLTSGVLAQTQTPGSTVAPAPGLPDRTTAHESRPDATGTSRSSDARGPDAAVSDRNAADRNDDVSALPRATSNDRTTLFGLSPTSAIVIAAGLLVVVVLAIVAMTRSDDTYFDS